MVHELDGVTVVQVGAHTAAAAPKQQLHITARPGPQWPSPPCAQEGAASTPKGDRLFLSSPLTPASVRAPQGTGVSARSSARVKQGVVCQLGLGCPGECPRLGGIEEGPFRVLAPQRGWMDGWMGGWVDGWMGIRGWPLQRAQRALWAERGTRWGPAPSPPHPFAHTSTPWPPWACIHPRCSLHCMPSCSTCWRPARTELATFAPHLHVGSGRRVSSCDTGHDDAAADSGGGVVGPRGMVVEVGSGGSHAAAAQPCCWLHACS